ncbi:metallophosphoesterase family protein [Planctomycetota bacterium]
MYVDRRVLALLLLLAATTAGACRGMKARVNTDYLLRHEVYRSRAFAREPYLFEVRDTRAEVICRSFDRVPPRLLISPFTARMTQAWERRLVELDDPEQRRLASVGLPSRLPLWQHHVTLSGLEPRTPYSVKIATGEEEVELLVRTLPKLGGEPSPADMISFLVLGNTGTGSDEQLTVAQAVAESFEKPRGLARGVDFIVHTGDMVYDKGAAADYEARFFAPYREVLRRTPIYSVVGDRDVRSWGGAAYFEAFPRGSLKQPYWRMNLGPVELLGCDTTAIGHYANQEFGKPSQDDLRDPGRQQLWLDRTLAKPTAAWRFLVLHDPALSGGVGAGSASLSGARAAKKLRRALRHVFGRVQFILQGQDPHYERSVPIAHSWIAGDGGIEIPSWAQGAGFGMESHARRRRVDLGQRTVALVQGAGGGEVGDTVLARAGWGAAWLLGLPLGSPLWLSYFPVGPDWVDPGFAWIDRAAVCYSVTRFDVRLGTTRLRTWTIDPVSGKALLADDVTYRRKKKQAAAPKSGG